MMTGLAITLGLLVIEVFLFLICYYKSKQPVDPANPRILPYTAIMILLALAIFATLAHVVSVVTGQQVEPRKPKGMR